MFSTSTLTPATRTFGSLAGPYLPPHSDEGTKPDALVVLLHGHGANGGDLFDLAQPLRTALDRPHLAVWAPNAPDVVPGMGGAFSPVEGYQWFPITQLEPDALAEGLAQSGSTVPDSLEAALDALDLLPQRLVVVGFSQGGMVALGACLAMDRAVAGVVGLSTAYLGPLGQETPSATPPVLLVHGEDDNVVPLSVLAPSVSALRAQGLAVESHVLGGLAHGIDQRVLSLATGAIARWL